MNHSLFPEACGNNAYKKWTKDGFKLFVRGLTGFNLLWVIFFFFRGWIVQNDPTHFVSFIFFVGISGILFQVHRVSFIHMVNGKTSISDILKSSKESIQYHIKMWKHNFWIRSFFGFIFFVCNILLVLYLMKLNKSSNVHAPKTFWETHVWLKQLFDISIYSAQCSYIPLLFRKNGFMSLLFPLMDHYNINSKYANVLNKLAIQRNHTSLFLISMLAILFVILLSSVFPFVYPLIEIIYLNIMMCAFGDIFNNGYKIEKKIKKESPLGVKLASEAS